MPGFVFMMGRKPENELDSAVVILPCIGAVDAEVTSVVALVSVNMICV